MGRRRRRRTRSDDRGGATADGGFPRFEHNQWTVEGEIERMGAFARGARSASGARRWVALLLVAVLVGPILIGIPIMILRLVGLL